MEIQPAEGSWKWGLRLVRYGSVEVTGQPSRVWAEDNRVYYRWDGSLSREWVENGERGLEQGFTVKERPRGFGSRAAPGPGPQCRGGLLAEADPLGDELTFRRGKAGCV